MSNYNDLSGQPRKQRREDGVKLYVGGVGEDCEDDELRVVFAPHGDVLDIWCAQTPMLPAQSTAQSTAHCMCYSRGSPGWGVWGPGSNVASG